MLIPLFTGQPLPSEKLQEVMEGLSSSLRQLEERFLQDKAFIIGSEISLADLVAVVELMQVSAGVWQWSQAGEKRCCWAGRGAACGKASPEGAARACLSRTRRRLWEWVQDPSRENLAATTSLFLFSADTSCPFVLCPDFILNLQRRRWSINVRGTSRQVW